MHTGDTIAAISSAVGPSARMIVRLSGEHARRIASAIAPDAARDAGSATRARLRFASLEVPAWVYSFRAPRSYTGEDVVELHIPGNPLLAAMLLDELIRRGARHAEAGEFTARAYFNGRLDLSEAEGVAATIAAHSQRELQAARQLMAGELARRLRPAMDLLADSLALVEVGIDFSDEEVSFLSHAELRERIARIDQTLATLLRESPRFESLSHEPRIVLVGWPNAGKSTLLNALAGEERAVVSPEAGTTRDAIWSHARLPRGMVRIIDIAGLAAEAAPAGEIERQMQQRAMQTIASADVVVHVRDATDLRPPPMIEPAPALTVLTKIDLLNRLAPQADGQIAVSAHTGEHLASLRSRLDALAFGADGAGGGVGAGGGGARLALNARHIDAITEARDALARALQSLDTAGPELIALELRDALDACGRILGAVSPDDVLGRIFATFCIGK